MSSFSNTDEREFVADIIKRQLKTFKEFPFREFIISEECLRKMEDGLRQNSKEFKHWKKEEILALGRVLLAFEQDTSIINCFSPNHVLVEGEQIFALDKGKWKRKILVSWGDRYLDNEMWYVCKDIETNKNTSHSYIIPFETNEHLMEI